MIQSVLSVVSALVGGLLLYVLLPGLIIAIAAAILLGIGSLLTRLFAVTVFEASLIVTIAAFPLLWLYARLLNNLGYTDAEVEGQDEAEPPRSLDRIIWVPPRPPRRARKKNR